MRWITASSPLIRFLLPRHCLLCGATTARNALLCAGCDAELPRNTIACRQCGLPLPALRERCGHCLKNPPHVDRSVIPLHYAEPVDRLIKDFKFQARFPAGQALAELLADTLLTRHDAKPEWIVPVPLHRQRLRERGFNQALELSRWLSRRLGIPVAAEACRRRRATAVQSRLDAGERRRNIRHAFAIHQLPKAGHLALVDDVVTTGHTVNELARVLKRAGVATVEVWAVARAARPG